MIAITHPAHGGEEDGGEQNYVIQWNVTGDQAALINFAYIIPDDTFLIVEGIPNDGDYDAGWDIPANTPSAAAKIIAYTGPATLADLDNLLDENSFTISGFTIDHPVTADGTIKHGQDFDIEWTDVGTPGNVDIWISSDGFVSDSTQLVNNDGGGAFDWTPAVQMHANTFFAPTLTASIRLWDQDGESYQTSDEFVYSGYVTTNDPDGDVIDWVAGTAYDIEWTSVGVTADNVGIYYCLDGDDADEANWTWVEIVSGINNTDGTYNWTVPNDGTMPTLQAVRVKVAESGTETLSGTYTPPFTIAGILFTYPTAAANLDYQATNNGAPSGNGYALITWDLIWDNYDFGNVMLEWSHTSGASGWTPVVGASNLTSSGTDDSFEWFIGSTPPGSDPFLDANRANCTIRIREVAKATWYASPTFALVNHP
jgi:hypothetical protein